MADTGQRTQQTSRRGADYSTAEVTGWAGFVVFAGVMMLMIGSFHAIAGLVALFEDDYYLVRPSGLVVNVDYTAWGWLHLVLGVLVALAGLGALSGQMWARVTGVVLAGLSAVANMVFIAAYPVWSIVMITLDVLVIYALIVHGREVKQV